MTKGQQPFRGVGRLRLSFLGNAEPHVNKCNDSRLFVFSQNLLDSCFTTRVNFTGVYTKGIQMSKNFDFLGDLANALKKNDWSIMHISRVAELLNLNGIKNKRGGKYKESGRGIFKLVSSACAYFAKKGDKETATNVASAFTNDKNQHVWKK